MTNEKLDQLKKIELQILRAFDQYCKEHHFQYYLIGGALLGSARYGGFIPWDDDIDVAMPREDYEKLKAVWQTDSIDGYFLQSGETDPNFARCIMKLRKNNTEIIEKITAGINMHHGIYIDIFPIDYVSDNSEKKLERRAQVIRRLMTLRTIKSGYRGNYQKTKRLIKWGIFWLPSKVIDKKIYRLCTLENNGDRQYAILYLHNYNWEKQIHRSEIFESGGECSFEGYCFSAPCNVEAFLSKVFGSDYMLEPPADKRKNPHNYISVRFE